MRKFRVNLQRYPFSLDKKISDIRDFREMTRCPFTSRCATLMSAKLIVEKVHDSEKPLPVEMTSDELAVFMGNWANKSIASPPHGWYVHSVEPVPVANLPLAIEYNTGY